VAASGIKMKGAADAADTSARIEASAEPALHSSP